MTGGPEEEACLRTRTPGKVFFPLLRPPGLQLSCVELTGKGPVCRRNCLLACRPGSQPRWPPLCPLLLQRWTKNTPPIPSLVMAPCAPHPGQEANQFNSPKLCWCRPALFHCLCRTRGLVSINLPFPILGLSLTLASTVFFLHGGSQSPCSASEQPGRLKF